MRGRYDVAGAPPHDPAWDYTLFVFRDDVVARDQARETERKAENAYQRLKANLIEQAVAALQPLKGNRRYTLAVQVFGFDDPDTAKGFADRRHVPTWIPHAIEDKQRRKSLASHYGRAADLSALGTAWVVAKNRRAALGDPQVRHAHREQSLASYMGWLKK